ncbi:aspartate aminotransferase family protein [bacterium]|nr:aspartate aminotransferase family protein [bacterium]
MSNDTQTQTQQWIDRYEAVMWNTFGRRRIALAKGLGSRVWDLEGNEYLDFLTGIAVNNLGHCHPRIVEAIRKQAETLIHCTNLYYIPAQIEWAELLVNHAFPSRVFFSNSGAEANEGMIKLARKYANAHFKPERRTIVCCRNSFHGRTLATLSATGQEKVQKGFEPLMPGFKFVDFNDCDGMRNAIDDQVCAILVEPVQGEGGVYPATQSFMDTLADLREKHGLLLLFDEVQTGLGRTGKNFSYEHFGVIPDALTLAKPLAGGLAAGAILAKPEVAEVMQPGSHGSTIAGNPLAAAAGKAYCEILFGDKLADRAAKVGAEVAKELRTWIDEIPAVTEIRALGLMIGIQLDRPGGAIVERCEKRGLLVNCTNNTVIRLLPPLNVSKEDFRQALDILREEIKKES